MFGNVQVVEQQNLTKMPQEAASAWSAFDAGMVGASYKPIAFVGTQIVKGTNYIFLAEQTLILAEPVRHIVAVTVNEFNNSYHAVSIATIF